MLGFPCFSLADSGFFNALRAKKLKKLVLLAARVAGCAKRPRTLLLSDTAFGGAEAWNQANRNPNTDLGFTQTIAKLS